MKIELLTGFCLVMFGVISCSEVATKDVEIVEEKVEKKDSTSYTPDVFHNYIVLKVDEVNAIINNLQLLDDNDVDSKTIIEATKNSHLSIDSIVNNITLISPSGKLGKEVKQLTLQYISSKKAIVDVYKEFASQLSIESEWNDDDYTNWTTNAEPYFGVSEQIWNDLNILMNDYVSENNITTTYL